MLQKRQWFDKLQELLTEASDEGSISVEEHDYIFNTVTEYWVE